MANEDKRKANKEKARKVEEANKAKLKRHLTKIGSFIADLWNDGVSRVQAHNKANKMAGDLKIPVTEVKKLVNKRYGVGKDKISDVPKVSSSGSEKKVKKKVVKKVEKKEKKKPTVVNKVVPKPKKKPPKPIKGRDVDAPEGPEAGAPIKWKTGRSPGDPSGPSKERVKPKSEAYKKIDPISDSKHYYKARTDEMVRQGRAAVKRDRASRNQPAPVVAVENVGPPKVKAKSWSDTMKGVTKDVENLLGLKSVTPSDPHDRSDPRWRQEAFRDDLNEEFRRDYPAKKRGGKVKKNYTSSKKYAMNRGGKVASLRKPTRA